MVDAKELVLVPQEKAVEYTLQTIKQRITQGEPTLLPRWQEPNPGLSSTYIISSLIGHSENPEVKADIVRSSIALDLKLGNTYGAINTLDYANAAQLNLPEYGDPFIEKAYSELIKDDSMGAWLVAEKMTKDEHRLRIVKRSGDSASERELKLVWQKRLDEALLKYGEEAIKQAETGDRKGYHDLEMVFSQLMFQGEGYLVQGYACDNPGEFAQRVANTLINMGIKSEGSKERAIIRAQEAGLPYVRIEEIRQKVGPEASEKASGWARRIVERLSPK